MYFDDALTSTVSALEVASALNHFVKEGITDKHFKIVAHDTAGVEQEVWVRPILAQDFLRAADDSQIIKCIASDGRRVDILIPKLSKRESHRATLLLGELPPVYAG